jgi:hypothetical protein
MCPPLGPKWAGEQNLLAGEGVGGPNSDDWTESLELYILCGGEKQRRYTSFNTANAPVATVLGSIPASMYIGRHSGI